MEEVIPIINKTKIDRLVYEFYGAYGGGDPPN